MQTAAVKILQNDPYKANFDRAYMIGYTDAMSQERKRRRETRERRERKKYFAMQKLGGMDVQPFATVVPRLYEMPEK